MAEVRVQVLYFGRARQFAQTVSEFRSLQTPANSDQLFEAVIQAHPKLKRIQANLRILVNGRFASKKIELKEGDRIAFVPPTAGG